MKKILAVVLCLLMLLPSCIPFASAKKEKETEVQFTLDLNERYTDIIEVSEGDIYANVGKTGDDNSESKRIVYIAILVTALVVAIVILIVTLKRVPDEEDVDISGTGKNRKTKEDKEE